MGCSPIHALLDSVRRNTVNIGCFDTQALFLLAYIWAPAIDVYKLQ